MNVAIIDDIYADRHTIRDYIKHYFSCHCSELPLFISEYENGKDFLNHFAANAFDIIFMDHFMNDLSGMETAKAIRETDRTAVLIYTTTSPDFAIECYRVRASGYLLKPITYEAFSETLQLIDLVKIKERQFIVLGPEDKPEKILLKEIIYCDISGHYTQIHMISLGIKRIRTPFINIARMLDPYPEFFLCYRGCMINMDMVVRVDDLNFFMINNDRIPFRQKEQAHIQKKYYDFLFQKVRCKDHAAAQPIGNPSI